MRTLILAALLAIIPATAHAQYQCRHAKNTSGAATWIDDLALTTPRSFTLDIQGASLLSVDLQFTHAANGALTVTCTGKSAPGDGKAVVDTTLTVCSVASGVCTLDDAGVFTTASLSADKDFNVLVGVAGQERVTCTVTHGGTPTAGDTIIATGRLCTH